LSSSSPISAYIPPLFPPIGISSKFNAGLIGISSPDVVFLGAVAANLAGGAFFGLLGSIITNESPYSI
jgi:hypothetical protein